MKERRIPGGKLHRESSITFNRRISEILESIQDGFFALDRDWRFTYMNQRAAEYLGVRAEDLLGQSIWEVFPQLVGKEHEIYGRKAMEDRTVQRFTVKGVLLDMWLNVSVYPTEEGISVYWQDITEQKKMEESLRLANERLDMAQNAAEAGAWDWDLRTGKIEGTPQMFDLAGLDPNETVAPIQKLNGIIHPEDFEPALSRLDQALKNRSLLTNEYRIIRPDGKIRWIATMGRGCYDDQGRPVRMIGICLDITERKKAEEELKEHRDNLDTLVRERTAELTKAYEELDRENERRKTTEAALRAREEELERERQEVHEVNSALRVLLKQRDQDKANMGDDVVSNIKISILPLLEKLKASLFELSQREILDLATSRLREIASPFSRKISSEYLSLTPCEIQVASLIREGKTSKEISKFLNVSLNTVITHRYNIRKKVGLINKKANLRNHLQTLV